MDMTRDSTTAPVMPPDPMHECKGVDSTCPKLRLGTSNAALHGEVEPGVRTAVRPRRTRRSRARQRHGHDVIRHGARRRGVALEARLDRPLYDFAVTADSDASFSRRMAGRVETGGHRSAPRRSGSPTASDDTCARPAPASGATRSYPAETPARRGSNIRRIGGAALISRPRKCSVLRPVRVKLRQAAFNNDIFANLAHTTRG